jgi:hypothetical protein
MRFVVSHPFRRKKRKGWGTEVFVVSEVKKGWLGGLIFCSRYSTSSILLSFNSSSGFCYFGNWVASQPPPRARTKPTLATN